MTGEEKAIVYTDNIHIEYNEILSRAEVVDEIRKAYIAGLKEGRETEREYVKNNAFTSMKEQGLFPFGKWHDLRKDPNDLPKNNAMVLTRLKNKRLKISTFMENKFTIWNKDYDTYTKLYDVIAWCEIPKFEK